MTDDTTTARRTLLEILLDRIERGALLDNERDLLRPLVAAEYTDAATAAAERAEAAIARVRELHRRANNGETCVYCAPMQRTGYDTTWPCDTIRALDLPASTPDDAPTTGDVPRLTVRDLTPPPHPGAFGAITDWATSVDERCPAHYKGEPPRLSEPAWDSVDYRCERRGHGLDSDHAVRLAQGSGTVAFHWTDAIAVYPTNDASSDTETPSAARCSPLVNADCPGHTDGSRCERAASNPAVPASVPDWATPDTTPAADAAGATT